MEIVNTADLRKNLKSSLDKVGDNETSIVVHRPHGKSVILLNYEDYQKRLAFDRKERYMIELVSEGRSSELLDKSYKDISKEIDESYADYKI